MFLRCYLNYMTVIQWRNIGWGRSSSGETELTLWGPVYMEIKPGVAAKILTHISGSSTRGHCFRTPKTVMFQLGPKEENISTALCQSVFHRQLCATHDAEKNKKTAHTRSKFAPKPNSPRSARTGQPWKLECPIFVKPTPLLLSSVFCQQIIKNLWIDNFNNFQ